MNTDSIRFKKHELAELTGINPRTILSWTQKGILTPVKKAKAQGKISLYSFDNAVEARVLQALSASGINLGKLPKPVCITTFPRYKLEGSSRYYTIHIKERFVVGIERELRKKLTS